MYCILLTDALELVLAGTLRSIFAKSVIYLR
jgi:hypothetical protein